MGIKYLWDTNTAIYYLEDILPKKADEFIDSVLENSKLIISAVTEIELLSWKFGLIPT